MHRHDWTEAEALAQRVLDEHGGVVPLRVLLAAGLTRNQVAALLRRGRLVRPRIGWYVDPRLPWQARPATRVGGVATCISAAPSWGIPVPHGAQSMVHVGLEEHASRLRHHKDRRRQVAAGEDEQVRNHWSRHGEPDGWRSGLVDTLLHLSECVPEEWFVAALDAGLHRPRDGQPILGAADLMRLLLLLPRRARRAMRLVDPRAESCIETLLRLGLVGRGIGPFDLQVWPAPWYRVDIMVLGRLVLEADGEGFHDPEQDAIRDAYLRSLGYVVLRFRYEEIVFDLESVLDRVEAAIATLEPGVEPVTVAASALVRS